MVAHSGFGGRCCCIRGRNGSRATPGENEKPMISIAFAIVVIAAIHAGMDGIQPLMFLLTGMLDVAIVWAVAVAIRGWPKE